MPEMSFSFGPQSQANLFTCHPSLVSIAEESIKVTPYDFSIIEGKRSIERQQEMFKAQLSHIDGITQKGKHNHDPSLAFDYQPWPTVIDGVSCWTPEGSWRFIVIAGVILATAKRLNYRIRWGGDWGQEGLKSKFIDYPHIELHGTP